MNVHIHIVSPKMNPQLTYNIGNLKVKVKVFSRSKCEKSPKFLFFPYTFLFFKLFYDRPVSKMSNLIILVMFFHLKSYFRVKFLYNIKKIGVSYHYNVPRVLQDCYYSKALMTNYTSSVFIKSIY